jgi:hypothetical protein
MIADQSNPLKVVRAAEPIGAVTGLKALPPAREAPQDSEQN